MTDRRDARLVIPSDFPLEAKAWTSGSFAQPGAAHSSQLECPIIDFRVRPPTAEVLSMWDAPVWKGLRGWLKPNQSPVPLDEYVRELRRGGVWRAVFPGRDIESTFDWRLHNDHVASVCDRFPDFFIGFAGIDPHKRREALQEIDRAVGRGLRGVAIDPYFQELPADHKLYYPVYAKCIEHDIPVVITTGPAPGIRDVLVEHGHPLQIDRVARDFPELTIIASHGGYPWVNEMITVANKQPGVYFEWSAYEGMPLADIYIEAANEVCPDKVLFAGLSPFTPLSETLARYRRTKVTRDAWRRLSFDNAFALLAKHGLVSESDRPVHSLRR